MIATVGLFVGPYRNLTTLTAGVLSLHPRCQVMNHGFDRLLPHLGFLLGPDPKSLDAFCERAGELSLGGRAGHFGGSILHSHAFERPALRAAYRSRYGDRPGKESVRCLVWKESLRVTRYEASTGPGWDRVLDWHPRLRLLLPIRHPLFCAYSNLRTGHQYRLGGLGRNELPEVLDSLLSIYRWWFPLQRRHPDRLFHFTEPEWGREMLARLAACLDLEADGRWLEDAAACGPSANAYPVEPADRALYERRVRRLFSGEPAGRDLLLGLPS